MNKIIILLSCLLPSMALAGETVEVPAGCAAKVVCPTHLTPKKKVQKKVVPVTKKKEVVQKDDRETTAQKKCADDCGPEPSVIFGAYAALGIGVRDQYVQGNLGLHLEVPAAHLGVRAFSALDKGIGIQSLIYAYRGGRFKLHVVDPGIQFTGGSFNYTNNTDVPRSWDLLIGAGIQWKLACNIDLTADWRINIANPVMLFQNDGVTLTSGPRAGQHLNGGHVVGNSFSSSHVLLGVLFHL